MRPNSRTSFFLLSGSVIGCHILQLSLFITILDAIYPRTRPLYIFLGRDATLTHSHLPHLLTYFHCNGRRFSLFWFGSLVLGLVEGFNGMEDGPSYSTSDICRVFLTPYLILLILSHPRYHVHSVTPVLRSPKIFMTPGLQQHIFPTIGRCRWLARWPCCYSH
jgi:hypothetical protein